MLLEVIATCGDDVIQATAGGADRIELVTGMEEGGMTPSISLIREAVSLTDLPVHVMIRPHSRSFVYDASDLRVMLRDIRETKLAGATGIVIGALTREGRVDREALLPLLEEADGLNVTFHRAFDEARNLDEALEDVLALPKVNRLLTSGGERSALMAVDEISRLCQLVRSTPVRILAGSGLTPDVIADFLQRTGVNEVHFGRGVRVNQLSSGRICQELIRGVKQSVHSGDET